MPTIRLYLRTKAFTACGRTAADRDDIINITLDFFEKEDNVYYRTSESFAERAYSDELIRELLAGAGFEVEAVYGDLTFESPAEDEQRAIYVAKMKHSRNKEN